MSLKWLIGYFIGLLKTSHFRVKVNALDKHCCSFSVINYLQLQKAIILERNYKHYQQHNNSSKTF